MIDFIDFDKPTTRDKELHDMAEILSSLDREHRGINLSYVALKKHVEDYVTALWALNFSD